MNRRGFLAGLLAVATVTVAPVVWTARKFRSLIVNVKDFGAVGDGITDDSAAFRAAMDYVEPGGSVYIPSGTYVVAGPLEFPLETRIAGAGASETIVRS